MGWGVKLGKTVRGGGMYIFWNHTTESSINAYADNNQLYFSHECLKTIETAINDDLERLIND